MTDVRFEYRCYHCGSPNHLRVAATVWTILNQRPTGERETVVDDNQRGCHEWDRGSLMACGNCGTSNHSGKFESSGVLIKYLPDYGMLVYTNEHGLLMYAGVDEHHNPDAFSLVTAPSSQAFIDAVNNALGTAYAFDDFEGQ